MMKRIVVLLLFIWLCEHSWATVYYVDVNGSDATGDGSQTKPWKTLLYAVTKVTANQGHVIQLSAGTFIESNQINIPLGVSIEGAGIDVTILKAAPSFYYNPADPGYAEDKYLIKLKSGLPYAGNQTLRNFTINGDGRQLHGGIFMNNRNFVTIDKVKIMEVDFNGIWLWSVNDIRVTNTQLINCAWGSSGYVVGALNIGNVDRVEIDNCRIEEDTGYGIKAIGPAGYNNVYHLKIHDCYITVNPFGLWNGGLAPNIAIELWQISLVECEIYNCYIDNNISLVNNNGIPSTGIQTIRVHHNVLDLKTRSKSAGYAIELTIHDVEVDNNYFLQGSYAIANWGNPMKNWDIHHNVFYAIQGQYPGEILRVQWAGLHNVKLYNNTVEMADNKTVNVIGLYGGNSENIDVKNNLFINSNTSNSYYPNQFIHLENGAKITSGLQAQNNIFYKIPVGNVAGTYANNLTVDPLITAAGDRPTPYYLLKAGSPAIDAGLDVGYDFEGSAPDIGAYEYTSAPGNVPPQINITSPANNASFLTGSAITINANATDSDGTISKVEFYSGVTKLGEDLTSPYSFTWNSVPVGTYALTAKATDNLGVTTVSSVVNITVTNPVPVVSITSPANNSNFAAGANVTINANATDSNGSVTKVEFFRGTTKLGEDLTSPYSFTWTGVPAGTYSLTAKATDNLNATATSTAVTISVTAPNSSPAVSVTNPANNSNFTAGTTLTLSANATDSDGTISKVEFYSGVTKLGEDATSPYSYSWASVPAGTYPLTARATDNLSAMTTSAIVNITVVNPSSPAVSITNPGNNATFTKGSPITITANATDSDGTVTKVEFYNGTTKLGEDLTSPYSFNWTNAPAGTFSLTARAIDNSSLSTTSAIITITVNNPNVAPSISITSPADNATFTAGASIVISVTATDSDGSVTKVEFFNGATKLGEDLTAPYTYNWSNLAAGSYTISAKATDNKGATNTDQAVIFVDTQNKPPVANAGGDQVITLPKTSVSLSGTGTDTDGTIKSYQWSQVSGPSTSTIGTPTAKTTNVTGLVIGTYVFRLVVKDDDGAEGLDEVEIKVVNAPVNLPPTAHAGEDGSIQLPQNSITLSGSGEDPDGTIASFQWIQVSGPSDAAFSDASQAELLMSDLEEGHYVFRLTVTDNGGLTGEDEVTITVTPQEYVKSKIPRYFTPNGDGINDLWEWTNAEEYANCPLSIYTRNGKLIYQTMSYENTWDGRDGGKPLQSDAYYYVIKSKNGDITGAVRIVR